MGTNYYWVGPKPDTCRTCGHTPNRQRLHIGKSSYGWAFALHVGEGVSVITETDGAVTARLVNGLNDWRKAWRSGGHIEDEYGKEISIAEMLEVIKERRYGNYAPERTGGERPNDIYLRSNYAEWDEENGLLRHNYPGDCVGRGTGTWDLIQWEFS